MFDYRRVYNMNSYESHQFISHPPHHIKSALCLFAILCFINLYAFSYHILPHLTTSYHILPCLPLWSQHVSTQLDCSLRHATHAPCCRPPLPLHPHRQVLPVQPGSGIRMGNAIICYLHPKSLPVSFTNDRIHQGLSTVTF